MNQLPPDFVIVKLSTFSQSQIARLVPWYREIWMKNFWALINFMQDRELATRVIFRSEIEINDDASLIVSDVTEEGLRFYQCIEELWCDAILGKEREDDLRRAIDQQRFEQALSRLRVS